MNTTGKKFGGRQKGTPNKLNSKIKDKLSDIITDAISTLDLEDMTKAERLKLIQLGMPYIITKPQQEEIGLLKLSIMAFLGLLILNSIV